MTGLSTTRLREPVWCVHQNPAALPSLPEEGETPPNRFDDPQRKYRVRYFATNKRGAFLEVLARFRADPETQARLGAVKSVDEKREPKLTPGSVPKGFLRALKEATAELVHPKSEFVDLSAPETRATLNKHPEVRQALKGLGPGKSGSAVELDDATLKLGGRRGRPVTQAVSRVVFDESSAAGIRYVSRLDAAEPCWAIFDWVELKFSKITPINGRDEALSLSPL